MNESTATRVQRLRRTSQVVGVLVGVAWLIVVVTTPVGRWMADRVLAVAGGGETPPGWAAVLLYLSALVVVWEGLALPAATLVAARGERRVRRHASTGSVVSAGLRDVWISAAVAVAFGAVIWVLLDVAGPWWWMVAGLLGAPVLVGATALAGVTVRAGGRTPVARPVLVERLARLTEQACGRPVPVLEWAGTAGTSATALVTGVGPSGAILLGRTLVEDWSDDEVVVVVAHELAHHVHRDLWRKAALDACVLVAVLGAAHLVVTGVGPGLGVQGRQDLLVLPVIGLTTWVAWWLLRPVRLAQSRAQERLADRYALDVTGDREAFRAALRRMAAHHLAEERPSTLTQMFFHRHPTVDERLRAAGPQ